jgi:hypothetical protein
MASTKLTFGSILTTVSTTANTVTALVGAAGVGATMLNAYAAKAEAEQQYQYKLDSVSFKEAARATTAIQLAQQAEEVNKAKAKSATFAASFDHYFELLKAIE